MPDFSILLTLFLKAENDFTYSVELLLQWDSRGLPKGDNFLYRYYRQATSIFGAPVVEHSQNQEKEGVKSIESN